VHDEFLFAFDPEEPVGQCDLEASVHGRDRLDPGAHVEFAVWPVGSADQRRSPDRLRVEEHAIVGEGGVKQTQDVHDALRLDASQRPSTEGDVEPLAWHLERFRSVHGEAHAFPLLLGQRPLRFADGFGLRVESEDKACPRCRQSRQSAFAATDVEYPAAVERGQPQDCRRLHAKRVPDLCPSRPLGGPSPCGASLRLVGLCDGSARAEFLRLLARVLEHRAGVGVDELAGLDSLEAVTL
jgi:hypothetical protein